MSSLVWDFCFNKFHFDIIQNIKSLSEALGNTQNGVGKYCARMWI